MACSSILDILFGYSLSVDLSIDMIYV
uniref:Uncharacterized protein n=1 Tax=Arundo donax TaxID=35708 RepID=A0A0A9ASN1_ARUDO